MNTPDTEWERVRREVEIELRTNYVVLTKEQLAKHDVDLLTSRDTYWKERLSGVCLTHGCFCQHSCKHPCTCTKAVEEAPKFTNEDNLK